MRNLNQKLGELLSELSAARASPEGTRASPEGTRASPEGTRPGGTRPGGAQTNACHWKKYLDLLNPLEFYHLVHVCLKNFVINLLKACDGLFEISARFKFADIVAAEFSGKFEILTNS